jgi:GGDEF domain-containing protein
MGDPGPPIWITAFLAARLLIMPLFFLGIILMLHGWMIASLRHMVAHDDLTGALSRRAFMAAFERLFSTAAGIRPADRIHAAGSGPVQADQ